MKKIIFATTNQDKMKEIKEILGDLDIEVLSLRDAGITTQIPEDGTTFEENALMKAKMIRDLTGEAVLADDSGLEIDFLNKEPGIYSARYMGENTSYRIKNANLLARLEGVSVEKRTARFVCAIGAAFSEDRTYTTTGKLEGIIGYEERGDGGFGYDPIFYLPHLNKSTAELSPEEKNALSHRGEALRAMKKYIKRELIQ